MRFGTYVSSITQNFPRLRQLKKFGYDFLEPGLSDIAKADDSSFHAAVEAVREFGLSVTACNNMFPSEIRVAGGDQNPEKIKAYLELAFSRAHRLGVKKVALGSGKSRSLPNGYPQEQGYADLISVIKECVIPACEKYGITMLIEPLKSPCNLVNTLNDGMRVVKGANHPQIKMLADSIHIMSSGEDMDDIVRFKDDIKHVHVSDWDRLLPEYTYSSELTRFLDMVKKSGYGGDISFEANINSGPYGLQRALILLKQKLM